MFKSITYLRDDKETNSYIYKFIDTEFVCDVIAPASWASSSPALAILMEYEKRNLYALTNIFKCNLCLSKEYNYTFEEILNLQRKYSDKYYPELHFNEKYYNELKNMWDKYKVLL